MRLLYFSPRDCWPVTTGARVRDFYLARELVRSGVRVTYLGFTGAAPSGSIRRERLEALCGAEVILVGRTTAYSPLNLVRGFLGPTPVNILNYSSRDMAAEVRRLLVSTPFDAVQVEGVHLSSYVSLIRRTRPAARIICDWHNIESELMARYAENAGGAARRLYARRTAQLLRRREDRLLRRCGTHTVCSERERLVLLGRRPGARIEVVENGVDAAFYSGAGGPPGPAGSRRNLVFVGSMDYHANIDAALYFAREVWPRARARRPDLEFLIVGSRPAAEILALGGQAGITVTGTVEDVRPYYRDALAVVVPLRVGSGTRLKALEAMAAGVPVVSTTLGIEGLAVTPGEDVMVADTPEALAEAIGNLDCGSAAWQALAANGRRLVAARYDWPLVGDRLRRLYAEPLSGAGA